MSVSHLSINKANGKVLPANKDEERVGYGSELVVVQYERFR